MKGSWRNLCGGIAGLLVSVAPLAAADAAGRLPAYEPHPVTIAADATYRLTDGTVYLVGNDGMEEMLTRFNALFTQTHPGIRFTMLLKGSSTALGGITAGVSAFAPIGRDAWPLEVRPFRQMFGYEPTDIRIGRDGYAGPGRKNPPAIYVNVRNPLAGLTVAQIAAIFTRGAPGGDVTHWNQVGAKGEWAHRVIHIYGPRDDGGLATALRQAKMGGRPFARTYEPGAKSADVIKAVAADPFGIGLVGFFDIKNLPPTVRLLPLAETDGAPFSIGNYDDVAAGLCPFAPYLHLYVNRKPGEPLDPLVKEYARLVLSREGQGIIATLKGSEEGYVPLTAAEAAAEAAKLE
jgi:phosphate transport system substrate-binding protein